MDDFGNDYIVIEDEDGNEYELEHIDTVEKDGVFYLAFLPTDMDEDDDGYGMVILKAQSDDDGDEDLLATIDDDAELDEIYALFLDRLLEEDEE
jgi:uncharacterized protein YrzB (UPF0473 family)